MPRFHFIYVFCHVLARSTGSGNAFLYISRHAHECKVPNCTCITSRVYPFHVNILLSYGLVSTDQHRSNKQPYTEHEIYLDCICTCIESLYQRPITILMHLPRYVGRHLILHTPITVMKPRHKPGWPISQRPNLSYTTKASAKMSFAMWSHLAEQFQLKVCLVRWKYPVHCEFVSNPPPSSHKHLPISRSQIVQDEFSRLAR